MDQMRKPFQGITNIIRFNWHFYALSLSLILLSIFMSNYATGQLTNCLYIICFLITLPVLISLLVSFYVYDLSGLYNFNWINQLKSDERSMIININAGFDETSNLLKDKFISSELKVLDFYDPSKHTEVSIKRARKAYPPFPNTEKIFSP